LKLLKKGTGRPMSVIYFVQAAIKHVKSNNNRTGQQRHEGALTAALET